MSGKTMFFIDGGYVRDKIQKYGHNWNWDIFQVTNSICHYIKNQGFYKPELIRSYYYDANYYKDDPLFTSDYKEKYDNSRLIFNAFNKMRRVQVKLGRIVITPDGQRQKGVDSLIAIDMLSKAFLNHYDIGILFCGDRDFIPIVESVKELTGKTVIGLFFENECPEDLIREFDDCIVITADKINEFNFY